MCTTTASTGISACGPGKYVLVGLIFWGIVTSAPQAAHKYLWVAIQHTHTAHKMQLPTAGDIVGVGLIIVQFID